MLSLRPTHAGTHSLTHSFTHTCMHARTNDRTNTLTRTHAFARSLPCHVCTHTSTGAYMHGCVAAHTGVGQCDSSAWCDGRIAGHISAVGIHQCTLTKACRRTGRGMAPNILKYDIVDLSIGWP